MSDENAETVDESVDEIVLRLSREAREHLFYAERRLGRATDALIRLERLAKWQRSDQSERDPEECYGCVFPGMLCPHHSGN